MNTIEQKVVHIVQMSPEKLAGLRHSVLAAAINAGCDVATVENLVPGYIEAECVICRLKVTGEELNALAFEKNDKPANPKISRFRLGFCGRAGCGSKIYSVHFLEHSILSWPSIIPSSDAVALQADQAQNDATPIKPQVEEVHQKSFLPPLVLRIILALAILFITVQVVRHFTGGRIPLLQPKHHYTINPDSVHSPKK